MTCFACPEELLVTSPAAEAGCFWDETHAILHHGVGGRTGSLTPSRLIHSPPKQKLRSVGGVNLNQLDAPHRQPTVATSRSSLRAVWIWAGVNVSHSSFATMYSWRFYGHLVPSSSRRSTLRHPMTTCSFIRTQRSLSEFKRYSSASLRQFLL